ncbi:MAG: glycosyl transferase family protein [Parcubacteria group bacterium Gr01-1014_70]|nr:MAG: glycosyl transferase family protein [Parcubacteria group bacterium Gr01-1014_70]
MKSFFNSKLIVLAVMVVLLSAAYSFYYHDRPRVDAEAYDAIARNLAAGRGYIEDRTNEHHPERDDAIVRVGPGYEFFLAGVYTLFGRHLWIVWILHALIRGASVIVLYAIGRMLLPEKEHVWLLSAAVFGFTPDLIVVNGLLLTETLFLFLFLYATYETLHLGKAHSRARVFWAGCIWGLAILTRPTALLPFLVTGGMLMRHKNTVSVLLLIIPVVLLVGPWSYYMSMRYEAFILTTTAGGLDLWVGNNPDATGGFVKTPEIQDVRNMYHSVEFSRIAFQKYVEFITESPFAFLELQWRKTALYFSLVRPTGFWIHLAGYPWHRLVTLFASGVWTVAISVIPFIVETRYRYALFPFLAVCAVTAYYEYPKYRRVFFSVCMLLFIFTAYDMWFNWLEIWDKLYTAVPF